MEYNTAILQTVRLRFHVNLRNRHIIIVFFSIKSTLLPNKIRMKFIVVLLFVQYSNIFTKQNRIKHKEKNVTVHEIYRSG